MPRVDCSQFAEALHELDRPGTPGAALREDALAHAELCSDCGALVTEAESLDFSLGQIAEAGVRIARSGQESRPRYCGNFAAKKSVAASRRLHFQLVAVGIAAAVLLVLGLSFYRPQPVAPDKSPAVSASAAAPASPTQSRPIRRHSADLPI